MNASQARLGPPNRTRHSGSGYYMRSHAITDNKIFLSLTNAATIWWRFAGVYFNRTRSASGPGR